MLNVRLPIEIDLARPSASPFAATRYETVSLPLPLEFDEIAIHESLLVAVHAQPLVTVTLIVPFAPLAGTACEAGEMLNTQASASCDTRTRLSLTAISVSRRDGTGLAAA